MASKVCPECKSSIDANARICAFCRTKQPSAARGRLIVIGLGVLAAILLLGQCGRPEISAPSSGRDVPPDISHVNETQDPEPSPSASVPLGSGSEHATPASAVDHAMTLCRAMEGTGLIVECEVRGWGETVDAVIDTTGGDARAICTGISELMEAQTTMFAGKDWKLRIFSPYSGDRPIAVCPLR